MMSVRECWLSAILLLMIRFGLVGAKSFAEENDPSLEDLGIRGAALPDPLSVHEVLKDTEGRHVGRRVRSETGEELIFDGTDMLLTPEQYDKLYNRRAVSISGHQMVADPWTDAIVPYEFQLYHFDQEKKDWILRAMRNWENVTCVRFRPAMPNDQHKITIKKAAGCSAALGMKESRAQAVYLSDGCFWKGTIEHELGHALGLIHEHQRHNRDEFIRIDYFGMFPTMTTALIKYSPDSEDKMGLGYDYKSVMHYPKNAFGKTWETQTIYPRDPAQLDVMGMTLLPSFLDAKLINLMYQCSERCDTPPDCAEPCFVNEHCQCFCEEDMPREVCADAHQDCEERMSQNGCDTDMLTYCRRTCGLCRDVEDEDIPPQLPCMDKDRECAEKVRSGKCVTDEVYMLENCRVACDFCPRYHEPVGHCEDRDSSCPERARRGDCDRHLFYMLENCRLSCDFCNGEHTTPTAQPGECGDVDTICTMWADEGKCYTSYVPLMYKCGKSCGTCENNMILPENCTDLGENCEEYRLRDMCGGANAQYASRYCKRSCTDCGMDRPSWMEIPAGQPFHPFNSLRYYSSNVCMDVWSTIVVNEVQLSILFIFYYYFFEGVGEWRGGSLVPFVKVSYSLHLPPQVQGKPRRDSCSRRRYRRLNRRWQIAAYS